MHAHIHLNIASSERAERLYTTAYKLPGSKAPRAANCMHEYCPYQSLKELITAHGEPYFLFRKVLPGKYNFFKILIKCTQNWTKLSMTNLPSYGIQLCNCFGHIFNFIIIIHNSVYFKRHVIFSAPITNSSQDIQMSLLRMMAANLYIDSLVKTVTGYCQNVQVLTCIKPE
jgi:hypothetical protein